MFPVSVCVFGDGVYGWRVEKMEAVQMDSRHLGVFYTGDSYIIVNKHSEGVELHMWMGERSHDHSRVISIELKLKALFISAHAHAHAHAPCWLRNCCSSCACAMLATQLLQFLRRDAVQHRQEQGHETDDFMKLFPNGVSYKRGGVESGFRRVQPECVSVRRLYQVKGRRNICVREVEPNWRSFNTGDCFILDLGQLIISWSGCKSSVFERQKVHQIAALIRDTERKGKAHINDVTQGEEPLEMVQVLGPIPAIKDSFEEDADADRTNSASLFKVSDALGRMAVTLLCDKAPFDQNLLQRDDCFLLNNGANGKIFIWKGGGANVAKKRAALHVADEFILSMGSCRGTTQVEIFPQGRESVLFKQFFKSWC